jgi:hypothetical protein
VKITYHNAHGEQLVFTLSETEVIQMIRQMVTAVAMMKETQIDHYVTFKVQFENDNDRWVDTDLDIVVDSVFSGSGCRAAFPCGKPVVGHPYCPDGPCTIHVGHDGPCFVRK